MRALALAIPAALAPCLAMAQAAQPLRCEVAEATDYAAQGGAWTAAPGAAAGAFTLHPMTAPEACTAEGCTTYTSGWVMVPDAGAAGPVTSASTCWTGMTPDAVICDLMGMGQVLVNVAAGTALLLRYEGFTYGLPDSTVSVALATCAAGPAAAGKG